ncbi:MAG: hypothetical protein OEW72_07350 [Gammaproteobacteria bacterium]|nr:hypothetical protein [Gammaproteobacteria bacterium]
MAKRVQDTKPARSAEAKAWVQENVLEQKKRHAAIQKEMNVDLAARREGWYREFLQVVQTKGFNANGDQRRVIKAADVPKKPNRPDKVVY